MDTITLCKLACSNKKLKNIFGGVYPSDMLPKNIKEHSGFIVNLDPKHLPGSHWIAIYIKNNKAYYFDSFGIRPYNLDILKFLKKHSTDIYFSDICVQDTISTSCGIFCLFFLYHCVYNKSLNHLSKTNQIKNEMTVKKFIFQKFKLNSCCKHDYFTNQHCLALKTMIQS